MNRVESLLLFGNNYVGIDFEATETKEIYKATLDIQDWMEYKTIKVSNVCIYDNSGNYSEISGDKINAISKVVDKDGRFDETPPELRNIIFSSNEVKVGDILEVTFNVEDDFTGVNGIVLSYYFGDDRYSNWYSSTTLLKDENNEFKFKIQIEEEMLYKMLKFNNMYISDIAGNLKQIKSDELESYVVKVVDENGLFDSEYPQVNSITANKNSINVGEELILTVDATDDVGIQKIYGEIELGNENRRVDFIYDENTNKYIYKLIVEDNLKYKKIKLQRLEVIDKSERTTHIDNYYNEYLEDIDVLNQEGIIDTEGPILNNIRFNTNEIKVGQTLEVTFDVSDDLSGVNYLSVNYYIGSYWNNEVIYIDENGEYKLKIPIEENMIYKTIRFSYIHIEDNLGNSTQYHESDLSNYKISVLDSNGNLDKEDPIISSLTANKTSLKVDDELILSVEASDDTGIERVYADIKIGNEYNEIDFTYDESTGKYIYRLPITQDLVYKKIKLNYVTAVDKADNETRAYNYNNDYIEDIIVTSDEGQVDNEDPIFNSISFSTNALKIGDTLEIIVDAIDEISRIDAISGRLEIGDNYNYISFEATEDGLFKYILDIDKYMKYSKIKFDYLEICDKAGNCTYIYSDELEQFARVSDDEGNFDEKAPTLNNITLNSKELKVGDNLEIALDISDDLSGISNVQIEYLLGTENNGSSYIRTIYKDENGDYKLNMSIEDYMLYKNLSITNIKLKDNAGNVNEIEGDQLAGYSVQIKDENGGFDTEDPKLNSITVDKTSVKVGEEFTITIDVSDDTGIDNIRLEARIGDQWDYLDATYDEESKKYIIKVIATEEMKYKTFRIVEITIEDKASKVINLINYYNEYLSDIEITDEEGRSDKEGPVFNGISFSKDTVKIGETLDIFVSADDELSGVNTISGWLEIGNNCYYVNFEVAEDGFYKYTLNINEDMKYSQIRITDLYIYDKAENYTSIYNDELTDKFATVIDEEGRIDETAPILNDIKFNSNNIKVGDTLEITFDISDDLSGISKFEVEYEIGSRWNGISDSKIIEKDENDQYKLQIPITEEMAYKTFSFRSINIKDNAGNAREIERSELFDYSIEISDKDGKFDTEDPVFNSVEVDKTSVKVGEEFTITIDASDDTGIESIVAEVRLADQWDSLIFNYDEETKKYVAKVVATEEMKYKTFRIVEITIKDKAYKTINLMNYDNEYLSDIEITDEEGRVDNESPIFNSITFSNETLKVGDTLEITINATDDLSGIKYISANMRLGAEYKYINFEATEDEGIYKYTLDITENMKYNKIFIENLNISDNAGNYKYVSESEIKTFSRVMDENGVIDDKAPILNDIKFSSDKVKVNDTLDIVFDTSDDLSGVDHIYIEYFMGDWYRDGVIRKNTNNEFKYSIYIEEDMLYKNIKIKTLDIYDKAGNKLECPSSLLNTKINVVDENGLMDNEAPELVKFEINNTNPKVGDTLEISVDAKDDVSGVQSVFLDTYIENYDGEYSRYSNLVYDKESNRYKGSIEISEDMKYKNIIFSLSIYDNSNKDSSYEHNELEIGDITISDANGKIDNYSPIFKNISISKDKAKIGDTVDIVVDAIDNESGIDRVVVNYSVFGSYYDEDIELKYDNSINKYKGTLIVSEEALYKMYTINSIKISDKASNDIRKDFKNSYNIYVTDDTGKIDIDLPEIKSMSVDKNVVNVNDEINISVEVSDKTSDIEKVTYEYGVYRDYRSIELVYNPLSKKYEGKIVVDESMKGQSIISYAIYATDTVGNTGLIYYEDFKDLIITVNGDIEDDTQDKEAPKFLGIKLDKTIVKPFEKVKISVDATDNDSKVEWVVLHFNEGVIDLDYNEESKEYEGYFQAGEYDIYKNYKLEEIRLSDSNGNITVLYEEDFEDVSFVVSDLDGKIDNTKPILTGYSILKNKFNWSEEPVIKIEFSDDLSGVNEIEIKAINSDGSKIYTGNANRYSISNNKAYISLDGLGNKFVNEKIYIEEIILTDVAGNKNIYTSDKVDFSRLTFTKGNYLEEEKVKIKLNTIYLDNESITGSTDLSNVGLRIYVNNGRVQILQETSSDSNGNFKFDISPNSVYDRYVIEAYDTKTNEALGYSDIQINKSADIIEDGVVDIMDLAEVAIHYGEKIQIGQKSTIVFKENTKYKSDINNDFYIDIYDLILVSKRIQM